MLMFVPYLTKVFIISAIMCGYYWLALRDKKFHRFNRFYLLSAVALPLILPLINLQVLFPVSDESIPKVFSQDIIMDNIIINAKANTLWSAENILSGTYFLIAFILVMALLISVIRIIRLNKTGKSVRTQGIVLVNTKVKGTPFSFFNHVFWNPGVDLQSADGIKMLNHELIHCRQWHSADKIFLRIVCSMFWFNPFFWIIKNEANLVHEFLADKLSFEKDSAAFSKIVLQEIYPGYTWTVANSFFYSPIKRRIMMLLKNNHRKVTYLGRLLVLPLCTVLFIFFSTRAKAIGEDVYQNPETADTIPNKNITSLEVIPPDGKTRVLIKDAEGNGELLSVDQANARGLKIAPPPTTGLKIGKNTSTPADQPVQLLQSVQGSPMYLLDGKIADRQTIENLSVNQIKSISVLKGNSGVRKYGPEGRNGVIELFTKEMDNDQYLNSPDGPPQSAIPAEDTVLPKMDKVFTKVEVEAQFPGGNDAWRKYITTAIQGHLDKLGKNDYGTCIVKFVVDTGGNVRDVVATTMKGTKIAEIAVNAIRRGPKWIPAQNNGHYVNAFRLQPVTLLNPEK